MTHPTRPTTSSAARRVVVTGMGLISPIGHDVETATDAAFAGRDGFRDCTDLMASYGVDPPVHVAATVEGFDVGAYVPAKLVDWCDRATGYALAAAEQALASATLTFDQALRDRTGAVIGASGPGADLYHRAGRQLFGCGDWSSLPGRVTPQLSGSIYSAMIAHKHGFRGPTWCVVNACATGVTAMAAAADAIRLDRADLMLAGGTDAILGPIALGSMRNAKALNPTTDPRAPCRPFSADREGLVVGEGAGVVVLEELEHARRRGATILAELLGDAQTNDAGHVYRPDTSGASWGRTMQIALDRAGVDAAEVDVVSAHAPSTRYGDLTETRALKRVLGPRAYDVPVSATKSVHGHLYGAAGAVETILALAAMRSERVLPTMHLRQPDPECDLDYVANRGRRQAARVLLKSSFGFGGTNACAVFRLPQAP